MQLFLQLDFQIRSILAGKGIHKWIHNPTRHAKNMVVNDVQNSLFQWEKKRQMQKTKIYSQCMGNMKASCVSLVTENSPPEKGFQNSIKNKNREVLSQHRWVQIKTFKEERTEKSNKRSRDLCRKCRSMYRNLYAKKVKQKPKGIARSRIGMHIKICINLSVIAQN